MNRTVPVGFGLLGLVLGAVSRVNDLAPALLRDSTPRSPDLSVFLLGVALFVLSTVVVAAVGYVVADGVALPEQFSQFALVAGVAGGIGFLFGGTGVLLASPLATDDALPFAVLGVGYGAVTKSVSIGLLGLAGASVAHFRKGARG